MTNALDIPLCEDEYASPPFQVRLRKMQPKWVVFVEISQPTKDKLYVQAISEVQAWIEQSARAAGVEWTDVSQELDSLRKNRLGLLMLQAAMKLPEDTTRPAFSIPELEQRMSTEVYGSLAARMKEFELGLDPDNITAEDIEAFEESVKKNDLSFAELWGFYGTPKLAAFLLFLVDRYVKSPTEPSSDGTSSEESA